jgi:hypothetical protein
MFAGTVAGLCYSAIHKSFSTMEENHPHRDRQMSNIECHCESLQYSTVFVPTMFMRFGHSFSHRPNRTSRNQRTPFIAVLAQYKNCSYCTVAIYCTSSHSTVLLLVLLS